MNTKHCLDCDACILGHDHHCVWIGKCVGQNNLCRFYCFVLSMLVMFVVFLFGIANSIHSGRVVLK